MNGAGARCLVVYGVSPGQPSQKPQKLAGNSCDVAAKTAAEDVANVRRRLFNVQLFVSAVDSALSNVARREQFFCYCLDIISVQLTCK